MSNRRAVMIAGFLTLLATAGHAQEGWTVKPAWVSAHENFLASPALRGRGGATNDELVAATYVASVFEGYGLVPVPGMTSYLQTAPLVATTRGRHVRLAVGAAEAAQGEGLSVFAGSGNTVLGSVATVSGQDPAAIPTADIVLIDAAEGQSIRPWFRAALAKGAKAVAFRETDTIKALLAQSSSSGVRYALVGEPASSSPDILVLSTEAFDRLKAAATPGAVATLEPGQPTVTEAATTNAIGWLQGSDPDAGVVMISAHLDHLGVRDGVLYPGANDDASGTAAVLELAHALAAGAQPKRSILFVAYGSEELGLLGSKYFAEQPPIPLETVVANLEIEMIGKQDPNMPAGVMMMTGFDRSDFGPLLKARGALIAPDLYPEQMFFQRSDNYALALKGIVAHTVSGWATIPTYHSPDDTIDALDIPFMTAAIQSLVEPLRALAAGDITPQWIADGRPTPRP